MAKTENKKDEGVSVDVPNETEFDSEAVIGSEKNPMRVIYVHPKQPTLATNIVDQTETDEERIRNSLWQTRDIAERIAQQILANPNSRYVLQGEVMATGKAGDYESQAELLAAVSFSYAKKLLAGLEKEIDLEVKAQLATLEAEASKDESEQQDKK